MLDEYRKDSFTLRAIIFVTTNDYPALFTLLGQFKGRISCVVCIHGTSCMSLSTSNKIVYMRHKCFLLKGHRYRMQKMDKYFENNDELHSTAPSGNNNYQGVFERVSNIKFLFGKRTKERKTRKDTKPALGLHSRRSLFSSSICVTRKR
jgi:hypothetical protein